MLVEQQPGRGWQQSSEDEAWHSTSRTEIQSRAMRQVDVSHCGGKEARRVEMGADRTGPEKTKGPGFRQGPKYAVFHGVRVSVGRDHDSSPGFLSLG